MNEDERNQYERFYTIGQHIDKSIYVNQGGQTISPSRKHPLISSQNRPLPNLHHHHDHKPLTISTIKKQEKSGFFDLFSCCREPIVILQPEYQDCDVCNRRVYKSPTNRQEESDATPYMSAFRMRSRQNQPVNLYYDKLIGHQLVNSRWRTD